MAWLWLLPALLLALACVPLGVAFEVTSVPRWRSSVRLDWAGLFETSLRHDPGAAPAPTKRETVRQRASAKRRRAAPPLSALVPALGHLLGLGRRLLAQARVKRFRLKARFGLDDPADTGAVYGAVAPLDVWLMGRCRECAILPEFTRECLEVSVTGRITLVPLRWLLVMGGFLLSPRTWRIALELAQR